MQSSQTPSRPTPCKIYRQLEPRNPRAIRWPTGAGSTGRQREIALEATSTKTNSTKKWKFWANSVLHRLRRSLRQSAANLHHRPTLARLGPDSPVSGWLDRRGFQSADSVMSSTVITIGSSRAVATQSATSSSVARKAAISSVGRRAPSQSLLYVVRAQRCMQLGGIAHGQLFDHADTHFFEHQPEHGADATDARKVGTADQLQQDRGIDTRCLDQLCPSRCRGSRSQELATCGDTLPLQLDPS